MRVLIASSISLLHVYLTTFDCASLTGKSISAHLLEVQSDDMSEMTLGEKADVVKPTKAEAIAAHTSRFGKQWYV